MTPFSPTAKTSLGEEHQTLFNVFPFGSGFCQRHSRTPVCGIGVGVAASVAAGVLIWGIVGAFVGVARGAGFGAPPHPARTNMVSSQPNLTTITGRNNVCRFILSPLISLNHIPFLFCSTRNGFILPWWGRPQRRGRRDSLHSSAISGKTRLCARRATVRWGQCKRRPD
jgi:hypothetical protein